MMDKRFDKKGVKFSKEQRIVFGDRVINPITRFHISLNIE